MSDVIGVSNNQQLCELPSSEPASNVWHALFLRHACWQSPRVSRRRLSIGLVMKLPWRLQREVTSQSRS